MAMMTITTRSSINEKPARRRGAGETPSLLPPRPGKRERF